MSPTHDIFMPILPLKLLYQLDVLSHGKWLEVLSTRRQEQRMSRAVFPSITDAQPIQDNLPTITIIMTLSSVCRRMT